MSINCYDFYLILIKIKTNNQFQQAKMAVQLIKEKNNFKILSKYDEKLIQLIKSFNKRHYEPKTRVWTLSNEEYDIFTDQLNKLNIDFDIMESDFHKIIISKENDQLMVSFNAYIEEFPLLKTFKDAQYNVIEKKLILPESGLSALENILNKSGISYKKDFDFSAKNNIRKKRPINDYRINKKQKTAEKLNNHDDSNDAEIIQI